MTERQIKLWLNKIEMAEFICALIESVETYVNHTPGTGPGPDREFHMVLLDESIYPENALMRLVLDMRHYR
jgi:hypothetical protein